MDGSLGLPTPEPLGEGVPDLHYFFQGDDAFALLWMVKLSVEDNSQGKKE